MKVILSDTIYRRPLEEGFRQRIPGVGFAYLTPNGEVNGDVQDAEIFIAWGLEGSVIEPVIKKANRLRWFHLMSAGVESLLFPSIRDSEIVLTNARGVFSIPISESVLAVMLYAAKNLRENFSNNRNRIWERVPRTELYGQTVGIIGMGTLGSEIARKLNCLGMRVIGIRRRPSLSTPANVDEVFGVEQLHNFLPRCDWLIISAPLTAQTRHLLREAEFKMMKPSAWYVNIARGEIADEEALLRAINQGWIAGACLDAFTHEPLPIDSPLWDHPKVVMTPHNSSASPNVSQRNLDLVFDNLNRFLKGKNLRNIVDKEMGY